MATSNPAVNPDGAVTANPDGVHQILMGCTASPDGLHQILGLQILMGALLEILIV